LDLINSEDDSSSYEVSEEIRNKMTFLFNSLTQKSIDDKLIDIRKYLENENARRWYSKILVVKRAPHENTLHALFIHLTKKLNKTNLFRILTVDSYHLLSKVLLTEKVLNQNEKNMLKNIGSWIGQLTVGRNKPILIKYLNLKKLISDAYPHNLVNILPLVCKILEWCKDSIFKNTNPWL